MTLTDAIAALKLHYGHRFHLDLQVFVDKSGKAEIEWSVFDPVECERVEAAGLDALVAMVTNPPDTVADLDAAGVADAS